MSLAYAQDYNAVERRLGEAMAAGEITLEQAQVMMDALRKAAGWEGVRKREAMDQRKKEYLAAEEKIRAAVAAGQLSAEDAEKRLIAMRKELFGDAPRDADIEGRRRRWPPSLPCLSRSRNRLPSASVRLQNVKVNPTIGP